MLQINRIEEYTTIIDKYSNVIRWLYRKLLESVVHSLYIKKFDGGKEKL